MRDKRKSLQSIDDKRKINLKKQWLLYAELLNLNR